MFFEVIDDTRKSVLNRILTHPPIKVISPLIVPDSYPALKMASLMDIGLMKLIAVSQRGARKDFVDLYAIHKYGLSINDLIERLPDKFPSTKLNLYHLVKSLLYFEDAEQEPMPRMLVDWNWVEIKDFFKQQQQPLWEAIQNKNS